MENVVILNGRLTNDVDVKELSSGRSFGHFTIAVDRNYKDDEGNYPTDFFNVVASGKVVDIIDKFFGKGSAISIQGALRNNHFTDKDGNKQYSEQIQLQTFNFLPNDSKGSSDKGEGKKSDPFKKQQNKNPLDNASEKIDVKDDQLPF